MESRKVQLTGGSTFTVSIPKDWARDNGIDAGDRLVFHPEDGALLVTPQCDEGPTRGELDVSRYDGEDLTRAVMAMYVSGFDVLELRADRITADERRAIRAATQNLVGLEVLEETGDGVVIRDLLDSSELSIHNAVTRMRLIALSMLEDAVAALEDTDGDIARDVIERDDDVDRLWFVVARIFRGTLRSPTAAAEVGVSREVCFDYHSSARQLERVADHAAKIAHNVQELDEVPDEAVAALQELHDEAAAVIDTAMDALLADDPTVATERANEARAATERIDERASAVDELLRDLDPEQARHLGLVVDSLSRGADYGNNVAETALQKAAPTP